jgi:hypothetical protein
MFYYLYKYNFKIIFYVTLPIKNLATPGICSNWCLRFAILFLNSSTRTILPYHLFPFIALVWYWLSLPNCCVMPRYKYSTSYHTREIVQNLISIRTGVKTKRAMTNNKFWEELIAYFPWYDTGHIENDASNNSSILGWVFVTVVTFLPSRCLATIRGFLRSRCRSPVSRTAYSSTLKMNEICSSETSVDFQLSTQRYIPEDRTLQYLYFCGRSKIVLVRNYIHVIITCNVGNLIFGWILER